MEFDLAQIPTRDAYKLLIGTVVPRPIAFVTTLNAEAKVNAAPFSFFNALSYDPCLVALGIEARPTGEAKDTAQNIRNHPEFVVNIVDEAIAERMNVCAADFPAGIDELAEAGLTTTPAAKVAPPRIAESPACLECRRYLTLELGPARNIILGQVLHIAVRDDVIDRERLYIDQSRMRPVGRLAGTGYAKLGELFDMPRIDVAAWLKRKD